MPRVSQTSNLGEVWECWGREVSVVGNGSIWMHSGGTAMDEWKSIGFRVGSEWVLDFTCYTASVMRRYRNTTGQEDQSKTVFSAHGRFTDSRIHSCCWLNKICIRSSQSTFYYEPWLQIEGLLTVGGFGGNGDIFFLNDMAWVGEHALMDVLIPRSIWPASIGFILL